MPQEEDAISITVQDSKKDFQDMVGFERYQFTDVVRYLQAAKRNLESVKRSDYTVPMGAIIDGPVGVGKSRMAACYAGVKYISVTSPSSSYMGGPEQLLEQAF